MKDDTANAVPTTVDPEQTAPMRLPADAFPNPFVGDDGEEDEEPTLVRVVNDFLDDEKTVIPTGD